MYFYFNPFQLISTYINLFPPISTYFNLFQLISTYFNLSQQITGQLSQITPFSLHKINMRKKILSLHPVSQVGEAIRLHIKIGRVYLLDITGEDHFGPFTSSCNDGLYLMWCKVLGFVDDKITILKTTSPDKCQWTDYQPFIFF